MTQLQKCNVYFKQLTPTNTHSTSSPKAMSLNNNPQRQDDEMSLCTPQTQLRIHSM